MGKEYIDKYREHPNQKAIEDFKNLDKKYLEPLMKQKLEGKGATINVTIQIPLEHVILASWLELRSQRYEDRTELEKPISDLLNSPPSQDTNYDLPMTG